ncbi:hypothetical protein N7474_008734 [Penicillium riverlandense]|uniref:uncharacterized protein n=1 Tax=Penicillium riverlandense TaxID=1903569 RepID=UPI0025490B83|nr:uncharacterized protein N7474_008734 [Penicillium riverlandense]KAJ5812433.1 hypothetical protein N7474_008734 [Penicillium riverlandense]
MPPWTPRTPASKLPRNMSEWRKLAQSKGLEHSSIRHARQLNSASKLRIEDYIRMRVIWPRRKQARNFPRLINSNKVKEILSGYKEFAAYLKGIGRTRTHEQLMEMGMFQLVRDSQLEVQNLDSTAPESSAVTFTHSQTVTQIPQSAHSDSSGPVDMILSITTSNLPDHDTELEDSPIEHTNDEQIVNEAMLEFLKAITMTIKGCLCKWTPGRAPFESMNFGKDTMTARTDGFLRAFDRKLIPDVFAIVEVKCQSRSRNKPSVFWQESAEMMAWMVHATMEGNRKCRSPTRYVETDHAVKSFLLTSSKDACSSRRIERKST